MNTFFEDVWEYLQTYYDELVVIVPKLVMAIVVLIVFFLFASTISGTVKRLLNLRMEDKLLVNFLGRISRFIWLFLGFLIALRLMGLEGALTSILAGAGISAFIIGFAFKDIGENFLAGLIMAFKRPFRIGDVVETQSITGVVTMMNFRDTQVKTFDGKDVYIPNGMIIKNPLYNYTIDGYLRFDFTIGLDYSADIQQAKEILLEVIHNTPGILLSDKKPVVTVDGIKRSTIDLKAYFWIDTFDQSVSIFELKTVLIRDAVKALREAGFYLPNEVLEIKNYQQSAFMSTEESSDISTSKN